ncbi:MAG TPA: cell wall anchor protein [Verrucomicrobiae bacterium]
MKTNKLLQSLATGFFLSVTLFLAPLARGQNLPYAWGWGFYAQMGNNTSGQSAYFNPVPVAVDTTGLLAGKTITAMAAGNFHSMALCSDGTLAVWGADNDGQLGTGQVGNNSTPDSLVPVAVNTTSGTSALFGKTVTAISAGYEHSLALCSDGTVAAWGWNLQGEIGDNTTNQQNAPVAVNTTSGTSALYGKTVTAVSAGDLHSLALCSDGTMVAWGDNSNGELGNNNTVNSSVPVAVITTGTPLAGKTVTAIGAGDSFNVALCSDGTLVAWGDNANGELGNNSTTQSLIPVAITTTGTPLAGKTVVAIAVGGSHTLALCSDGTLVSWGYDGNGQLGNNTYGGDSLVPIAVNRTSGTSALFGKTVVAIAAGSSHSLALCSDGTLTAWGWDFHGELGDNNTSEQLSAQSLVPAAVVTTKFFTHIFAGSSSAYHNLAIASDCGPANMSIAQYAGVSISGSIGCTYEIDYTTNLNNPTWIPLVTNTLLSNPFLFIDTNVISGSRFYRAVTQ